MMDRKNNLIENHFFQLNIFTAPVFVLFSLQSQYHNEILTFLSFIHSNSADVPAKLIRNFTNLRYQQSTRTFH